MSTFHHLPIPDTPWDCHIYACTDPPKPPHLIGIYGSPISRVWESFGGALVFSDGRRAGPLRETSPSSTDGPCVPGRETDRGSARPSVEHVPRRSRIRSDMRQGDANGIAGCREYPQNHRGATARSDRGKSLLKGGRDVKRCEAM